MQKDKIRVLIQRPGEPAEERFIVDELHEYYKIIGTDIIEIVAMPGIKGCVAVIDEEGKLKESRANIRLPEYGDVLVGTAVICGDDGMGEMASLTDEQIIRVKAYMEKNDMRDFQGTIEPHTEVYSFDSNKDFFKALFGDDGDDSENDDDNCM